MHQWGFLTNHAHVLLCIAGDPDTRLRHIADCVGITERATHRLVCDLVDAGYLKKHRVGRRSYYEVDLDLPLKHPLEGDYQLSEMLKPLLRQRRADPAAVTELDAHVLPPPDVVSLPG